MEIETLSTGLIGANTYIVWTKGDESCIVIDPGGSPEIVGERLRNLGLKPEVIVLTHGHFDHIGGVKRLREQFGAKVLIHERDAKMLTSARENLSRYFGLECMQAPPDGLLQEGQAICSGQTELKVLHTPGHSPGGVCLTGGGAVFTGDTLFRGGVGRTDFPGGDSARLLASIKEKLLPLPDETRVYPGHGGASDIGYERTHNAFLRREDRP